MHGHRSLPSRGHRCALTRSGDIQTLRFILNKAIIVAIQLHQQYAVSDIVRVWLGISEMTRPPPLRWFLDGVPASPTEELPLTSVRPESSFNGQPPKRVSSGSFTFGPFQPSDHPRVVRVETDQGIASI